MSAADLANLEQSYLPDETAEAGFDRLLGLALPRLHKLLAAVEADMDATSTGLAGGSHTQ